MRVVPVSVDVEADGPCPGHYSMVSFGAVAILNDKQFKTFHGKVAPISEQWIPEALKVSGHTRGEHESFPDPESEMNRFRSWLGSLPGRPQFWSDNPAFDWQFINFYLHGYPYGGTNPFGWSARRIGDLYCGMTGKLDAKWRHLRITKHTHNPVDDAMGNAEALVKIFNLMKGNK